MSTPQEGQTRRGSVRTCAGCRAEDARDALLRLAFDGARLVPDSRGRLGGRGAHLHPRLDCLAKAVRGGFSRALRTEVRVDANELAALLRHEQSQRADSLLGSAVRARRVVYGSDETERACHDGRVALVVVARDARAAADLGRELSDKAPLGVAVFGDKASLGRLLGRDEVGIVGVLDAALARSISETAARLAGLTEGE